MSRERDKHISVHLTALRNLGWQYWDPIGLKHDRKHCDDEYDTYMLEAHMMCKSGATLEMLSGYFERIETEYIGLARQADTEARAFSTAMAVMKYASSILSDESQ